MARLATARISSHRRPSSHRGSGARAGCLQHGEVLLAREVLSYMTSAGIPPSAHSFTTLLHAAASRRRLTATPHTGRGEATKSGAAFALLLRQLAAAASRPPQAAAVPGEGGGGGGALDAAVELLRKRAALEEFLQREGAEGSDAGLDAAPAAPLPGAVRRAVSGLVASDGGAAHRSAAGAPSPPARLAESLAAAPQPFLVEGGGVGPPSDELRAVFAVFGEMRASGVSPDRAAFNALVHACAREGDVPRAEGAFGEMVAAGIGPDAISYTCLLKAC